MLKTFVWTGVKHSNGTCFAKIEAHLLLGFTEETFSTVSDNASSWKEAVFLRHYYCAVHGLQLTDL